MVTFPFARKGTPVKWRCDFIGKSALAGNFEVFAFQHLNYVANNDTRIEILTVFETIESVSVESWSASTTEPLGCIHAGSLTMTATKSDSAGGNLISIVDCT